MSGKAKARKITWKPKDLEEGGTDKALIYLSVKYPQFGDGSSVVRLLEAGMRVMLLDGERACTHEAMRATLRRSPRDFHLWISPMADGPSYVEMRKGAGISEPDPKDEEYPMTAFLTIRSVPHSNGSLLADAFLEIAFAYPPISMRKGPNFGFGAVEAATALSKEIGVGLGLGAMMGYWTKSDNLARGVSICIYQGFESVEDAVKWAAESMEIAKKGLF